ncbi:MULTISPECIES: helix-turn-helix domain-containing protein [Streptomyces]|uniref:helix-turn-helix domain-containing protein n=1 Tax=Streptomyces TaxID=1883 RepID=UPI001677930F|nr:MULTISPECIES: helix-turn-helix transcriptional regulator [Streptomyces]MBD3580382.1 helix-turn-helix domain-containing protein [Streptomyces sp. KD18]GGT28406.1 transcriptional regulator [Streptomyces toxytricini]
MPPRKRVPKNGTALKMVGAQMAVLRVRKGLTQRQLAKLVRMEEETIASIEQGRRALMPDVAEMMDRVLESGGVLAAGVERLPAVDQVPSWAEEYLDRERDALAISSYENQVLPGLLQTDSYAEAVFRNRVPLLPNDVVSAQTAIRIARREILRRETPVTLSFIVWEPVLRLKIGGPEVHREQLAHLLSCSKLPGVSIQVYPLDHTSHPALDGPFVLLETPDHQRLAYAETQRGSQLISDMNEVSILERRYAMLRTQALNPVETRAELDRLLGEL